MTHDISAIARESMVVSQLQPSGVIDEAVLNAYRAIPREWFVPQDKKPVCYVDDCVSMPGGRFLMEPMVHGLMVENLKLTPTSRVLDIAGLTGYSAAILSQVAGEVYAIEQDEAAITFANEILPSLNIYNVQLHAGSHVQGWPQDHGYDAILVNGSLAFEPTELLAQLKPGGKLACVMRSDGQRVGKITIFSKTQSGVVGQATLLDAWTGFVPGFEPKPSFSF